jgi:hypothetical protein
MKGDGGFRSQDGKGKKKIGGGDGRRKTDAAPRTSHRRLIRATLIEASTQGITRAFLNQLSIIINQNIYKKYLESITRYRSNIILVGNWLLLVKDNRSTLLVVWI